MKIEAEILRVCQARPLPAGLGCGPGPGRRRAGGSGGARISGTRPGRWGGRFSRHEVGVCSLAFGVDMAGWPIVKKAVPRN